MLHWKLNLCNLGSTSGLNHSLGQSSRGLWKHLHRHTLMWASLTSWRVSVQPPIKMTVFQFTKQRCDQAAFEVSCSQRWPEKPVFYNGQWLMQQLITSQCAEHHGAPSPQWDTFINPISLRECQNRTEWGKVGSRALNAVSGHAFSSPHERLRLWSPAQEEADESAF